MGLEDIIFLIIVQICAMIFGIRYILIQIGKAIRSYANGD